MVILFQSLRVVALAHHTLALSCLHGSQFGQATHADSGPTVAIHQHEPHPSSLRLQLGTKKKNTKEVPHRCAATISDVDL